MVITARMASTSVSQMVLPNNESSQEMYQKALKLLQDPILPVRAHGLLLLRQIITSTKDSDADRSLVPAILSIFLQCIEDDDSYMFLNAVQGLAVMVDKFGKDVLKGLVDVYSRGLNGSGAAALTQHEVDVRIRVGEALGQVIRRCGEALGSYGKLLFWFFFPSLTLISLEFICWCRLCSTSSDLQAFRLLCDHPHCLS